MKKILALLFVCSMCLLTACGGMSNKKIQKTVEEFILCVEEDRFSDAAELIHSECKTTADEVSSYFALLEKDKKLDFTKGFQLLQYEFEDFEEEEPTVVGEYVKASGTVEAGDCIFTFDIKLVENENDFGIYKIKFREKE